MTNAVGATVSRLKLSGVRQCATLGPAPLAMRALNASFGALSPSVTVRSVCLMRLVYCICGVTVAARHLHAGGVLLCAPCRLCPVLVTERCVLMQVREVPAGGSCKRAAGVTCLLHLLTDLRRNIASISRAANSPLTSPRFFRRPVPAAGTG